MALNRNGQRGLKLFLLFYLLCRIMLKSPPIKVGNGFCWEVRTSSDKKVDLNPICARPYTAIRIHLKSSFLLRRWINLIKNFPSTIMDKSRTDELTPKRIPPDLPLRGRQFSIIVPRLLIVGKLIFIMPKNRHPSRLIPIAPRRSFLSRVTLASACRPA